MKNFKSLKLMTNGKKFQKLENEFLLVPFETHDGNWNENMVLRRKILKTRLSNWLVKDKKSRGPVVATTTEVI